MAVVGEVGAGRIRAFIEAKLTEGVNPATIRIFVAILSALFTDLAERGSAQANPARNLPRSIMRLMRPTHDPCTTPFIERLDDVHLTLPRPLDVAYEIGALAGLRTGEVFALKWAHVDPLLPILTAWQEETGGEGLLIPPMRCDGDKIDKHTPGTYLRVALEKLGLARPGLG